MHATNGAAASPARRGARVTPPYPRGEATPNPPLPSPCGSPSPRAACSPSPLRLAMPRPHCQAPCQWRHAPVAKHLHQRRLAGHQQPSYGRGSPLRPPLQRQGASSATRRTAASPTVITLSPLCRPFPPPMSSGTPTHSRGRYLYSLSLLSLNLTITHKSPPKCLIECPKEILEREKLKLKRRHKWGVGWGGGARASNIYGTQYKYIRRRKLTCHFDLKKKRPSNKAPQ